VQAAVVAIVVGVVSSLPSEGQEQRGGLAIAATQPAGTQESAVERAGGQVFQVNLDGVGGMVFTPLAAIAHSPPAGEIGRPVVGLIGAAGHDKILGATSLTVPITDRLEVGVSHETLHLGSLRHEVRETVGLDMGTDHVGVETVGAKYILVPAGGFSMEWMPAVAVGAYYKRNCELRAIDKRLLGGLKWMGMDDDDGVDFTVTGTRAFPGPLGGPMVVSAGVRFTEANQAGFFGFSDGYRALFEGNVAWAVSERWVLGAEYRQKPDRLRRAGSLYLPEDNAWAVFAAYRVNEHLSIGLGCANVGRVANSREHALLGLSIVYGF
jgi:hypothetical protein